jgi:hypothetical protein
MINEARRMNSGDKSAISTDTSFSDIVDDTCERLKDKQVQYSIRRIQEMEDILNGLELELNQFLFSATPIPGCSGGRKRAAGAVPEKK